MDPGQISRLREEQLIAIEQTNSRISQLTKYKEDYEALRDRLKTLPGKIQHDVMVPFGDLAFMPGQLIHTNEILVLLGDNWFVDRSASQAVDIVKRRIKSVDRHIEELEQQKGLLQPRLEYTSELTDIAEGRGNVKDIREDYDEEREEIWKEQHRKSVRRYHDQLRKEREAKQKDHISVKEKINKPMTDEELWARLDELELHEQAENEMDKLSQEDSFCGMDDKRGDCNSQTETEESEDEEEDESSKKKVRWKESSGDARPKKNVITFAHSPIKPPSNKTETDEIQNPGDIYKQFVQKTSPTSILKSPSVEFPAPEPVIDKPEVQKPQRKVMHVTSDVFTGSIVERTEPEQSSSQNAEAETKSAQKVSKFKARQLVAQDTGESRNEQEQLKELPAHNDDPPKRVSKFKAQRQQMQR